MTCQRRMSYRPIHFREGGCSSPSEGGWAWYRVGHQPRFLACLVNNLRVSSVALEREGRACPAFERHEVFEARPHRALPPTLEVEWRLVRSPGQTRRAPRWARTDAATGFSRCDDGRSRCACGHRLRDRKQPEAAQGDLGVNN